MTSSLTSDENLWDGVYAGDNEEGEGQLDPLQFFSQAGMDAEDATLTKATVHIVSLNHIEGHIELGIFVSDSGHFQMRF